MGSAPDLAAGRCCCQKAMQPQVPYELAVTVKLDDEAGAAGLVFHSDGGQKHYGFYPSNGHLGSAASKGRTFSRGTYWQKRPPSIIGPASGTGSKSALKKTACKCFVNDELVIESTDAGLADGRVGLAKFRNTGAEFRLFAVGKQFLSRPADR